jgi:hypothetical protein
MDVVVVEKELAKHRVFVHPTNNDEKNVPMPVCSIF